GPSLVGVAGGAHNFFERTVLLVGELGEINYLVFALGVVAILLLVLGERIFPARPVGLAVVALSIAAASAFALPDRGVPATGEMPAGVPPRVPPPPRPRAVAGVGPPAPGWLPLPPQRR